MLLCSSLAQVVSALLHSPVALAEAFLWGGGMSGGAVCTNLASGVLVFSAAGVLNRRANVMTSNLGVNALGYRGPAGPAVLLVGLAGGTSGRDGSGTGALRGRSFSTSGRLRCCVLFGGAAGEPRRSSHWGRLWG